MERNRTADTAKCLFIVFIVFLHAAMSMGKSSVVPGGVTPTFVVMTFGYSGLLMLFALSGYFYNEKRSFLENTKKRFFQLFMTSVLLGIILPILMLIPMAIKGLDINTDNLIWCITENVFGEQFIENVTDVPSGVWMEYFACCTPLYFIQALFASCVIFYAIAKIVLKDWRYSLAAIVILSLISGILMDFKIYLPFFFHEGFIGAAFMILGAVAKKHNVLEYMENGWRESKYWIILIICAAAGAALLWFCPIKMELHNSILSDKGWWASIPYFVSMALAGYVMMNLMSFISKIPKFSDVVVKACAYSFIVYMIHEFVLKFIAVLFLNVQSVHDVELPFSGLPQALLFGLITLVISFAIAYAVKNGKKRFVSDNANYGKQ